MDLEYLEKVASECYENFLCKVAKKPKASPYQQAATVGAPSTELPKAQNYEGTANLTRGKSDWEIANPEHAAEREKNLKPVEVLPSKTYKTPESVEKSREAAKKAIETKPQKGYDPSVIDRLQAEAEKDVRNPKVEPKKSALQKAWGHLRKHKGKYGAGAAAITALGTGAYLYKKNKEKTAAMSDREIFSIPGNEPNIIDLNDPKNLTDRQKKILEIEDKIHPSSSNTKTTTNINNSQASRLTKIKQHLLKHKGKYGAGATAITALGTGAYLYKKNNEKTASMYSENPLVNFELAKVACAEYLEKRAASHNNTFEQYGNDVVYDLDSLGKTTVNAMTGLATNPLVSGAGVGGFVGEQVARRMGAGKWGRLASTLGLGSLGYLGMHDGANQYDKRYR